jgi:hypothetical protein
VDVGFCPIHDLKVGRRPVEILNVKESGTGKSVQNGTAKILITLSRTIYRKSWTLLLNAASCQKPASLEATSVSLSKAAESQDYPASMFKR